MKAIDVDCVNRVKLELVNDFEKSIFESAYDAAFKQVSNFVNNDEKNDEAEYFCNGDVTNNIISFVGERGMGKSSAMLSFAYFLKYYPYNITENAFLKREYYMGDVQFSCLPKIDAGMLNKENLLDIIIANMWIVYRYKLSSCGNDDNQYNYLKRSFEELKNAYSNYIKKEDADEKYLTMVRQFEDLASSISLRKCFTKLVKEYLSVISDSNSNKNFLIIPVDDLDLVERNAISVLEEIRVFLSIPQVIILTTVNVDKLMMAETKRMSKDLYIEGVSTPSEVSRIREYSEQFIAKAIPRNGRIYMSAMYDINDPLYVLNKSIYFSGLYNSDILDMEISCLEYPNAVVASYTNIILPSPYETYYREKTLRDIVNKFNELWNIVRDDGENKYNLTLDWLFKEYIDRSNKISNSDVVFFLQIIAKEKVSNLNRFVYDWFDRRRENSAYLYNIDERDYDRIGYGKLIGFLSKYNRELGFDYVKGVDFTDIVSILYSIVISKLLGDYHIDSSNEIIEKDIIKDDIISGFLDESIFGGYDRTINVSFALKIDTFVSDSITSDTISLLTSIQNEIENMFKASLFFDKKTIEKIEFNVYEGDSNTFPTPENSAEVVNDTPVKNFRIIANDMQASVSIDNLFRNVLEYESLHASFLKKIVEAICKHKNIKHKSLDAFLKKRIHSDDICNRIRKWKKKNSIDNVYDLIPVQDMGIMIKFAEMVSANNETRYINGSRQFKHIVTSFKECFKKAEKACRYDCTGRNSYAEKMNSLLDILDIEDVIDELTMKTDVMGEEFEKVYY